MHAVGEQGRRQGVARETFIGSTVEFETDALSSIDPPAARRAKTAIRRAHVALSRRVGGAPDPKSVGCASPVL